MSLNVQYVSKSFGSNLVLSNITFSLNQGEILGIIGPNGAGKTTLLNIISGFLKPDSGRIIIGERDVTGLKPHQLRRLGVIRSFQIPKPAKNLTVLENVMVSPLFGQGYSSLEEARKKAEETLNLLGLAESAERYPDSLSSAELKKLELARVLAADAKLALLDEVTAGHSEDERKATIEAIKSYHRVMNVSLIVVDHVLPTIIDLCPRVIVLDKGVKIAEGTPTEIFNNSLVIESYVGEAKYVRAE